MTARGFTLVEVLMTMLILSFLSGVLLVFAQTGGAVWQSAEARLTSLDDAQRAMNRLTEDIRRASQGCFGPCTADDLSMARRINGVCDDATRVTYRREATGLLSRTAGAGAPQIVATGLTALTAACQPQGVVAIAIQARADAGGRVGAQQLESQVWVQNP